MGYLKIVSYLYLVAAACFLVDGFVRLQDGDNPYISFAFGVLAIFMFFFRRRYQKKFSERNREK